MGSHEKTLKWISLLLEMTEMALLGWSRRMECVFNGAKWMSGSGGRSRTVNGTRLLG